MTKDIKNVELFLFDLDGTVYIGDNEIEGSFEAVNELRKMGKRICFFTNNSSRMHTDYIARLNNLGLRVYSDEIYTSGQVTCEYILDHFRGSKVYLLGNERLRSEFLLYGIELTDTDPDIAVLGFDTTLTYDRLYQFCKFIKKGIPYIATHPDFNCPAEECPMPDVGAFIEAIRLTTDRVPEYIMGKPHSIAGDRISKRYNLPPSQIAMVGDRLYTDIAFGKNCGFVSILVLSGETTKEMADKSEIKPDVMLDKVKDIIPLMKG
ncbi:MAG: HAD-IIA family hydrolase [Acidaminococcus sp.]|nr:HAD-IIA family hydrolase [Acidaminococcus sp.]MDD7398488.1 HAD-IIA family hydrolase [Bacillota bacterium]MDY4559367.1 HAD-IIA family hydrolase [Eubacteriales bacterium]MDY5344917.1 HAD-IIA family hydrolase [Eubacteriales bacterium]